MERLGLGPGELVFVDDTAANIATALELGWTAIQFVEKAQAISEISEALGAGAEIGS